MSKDLNQITNKDAELLQQLLWYTHNSDTLSVLDSSMDLPDIDNSGLNCIDCIGRLDYPNVTAIAEELFMTRGAISKIVKKLIGNGYVIPYQLPDNKQKIFYRLTDSGIKLYEMHLLRHRKWEQRELGFFKGFDEEKLNRIIAFMKEYNSYLQRCIEEYGGAENAAAANETDEDSIS